jgi:DNA polymerase III subunit beta
MEFEISRATLLNPLRLLTSIVERKQTLPILGNVLLVLDDKTLSLTTTDSEIEMRCQVTLDNDNSLVKAPESTAPSENRTTLPALKLFEIWRSLGDQSTIMVRQEENRVVVRAGRGRFSLAYLPAEDFPSSEEIIPNFSFSVPQNLLKRLFAKTQFAMAQQDVRYYLNGLLLDLLPGRLNVVATDGHRLALARATVDFEVSESIRVIVPRKTIIELTRSLEDNDAAVEISIAPNHIRFALPTFVLTSKLIDGNFPDYQGVIPSYPEKDVVVDKESFKQALARTAILSNDKYKGVRLNLSPNLLQITAHNPEQEEAEEEIDVIYEGDELEIGFNVAYLQDVLSAIDTDEVELHLTNSNSSCLMCPRDNDDFKYVIMPMRL